LGELARLNYLLFPATYITWAWYKRFLYLSRNLFYRSTDPEENLASNYSIFPKIYCILGPQVTGWKKKSLKCALKN